MDPGSTPGTSTKYDMKNLKPIIIENSRIPVILSKFAPIEINAISLSGLVFCRGTLSDKLKRHETIHFQQQLELLIIPFYILYLVYFLLAYKKYRNGSVAYHAIPFEKEAYGKQLIFDYLSKRKRYNWLKYKL